MAHDNLVKLIAAQRFRDSRGVLVGPGQPCYLQPTAARAALRARPPRAYETTDVTPESNTVAPSAAPDKSDTPDEADELREELALFHAKANETFGLLNGAVEYLGVCLDGAWEPETGAYRVTDALKQAHGVLNERGVQGFAEYVEAIQVDGDGPSLEPTPKPNKRPVVEFSPMPDDPPDITAPTVTEAGVMIEGCKSPELLIYWLKAEQANDSHEGGRVMVRRAIERRYQELTGEALQLAEEQSQPDG